MRLSPPPQPAKHMEALLTLVQSKPLLLSFVAYGTPIAQGSKIRNRHGGMREASKQLTPWRQNVAREAALAMRGAPLLAGPLEVRMWLSFPRPKAHFGTGRNASQLRPSAPKFHAQTPDVDKCVRAMLDGMAGVVYRNDSQVAAVSARRMWGERAQAQVEVRGLQ